jgi:hypothetical protein
LACPASSGLPGLRLEAQQDRGPHAARAHEQAAVLPDAVVGAEAARVALVLVHVVDAAPWLEAEVRVSSVASSGCANGVIAAYATSDGGRSERALTAIRQRSRRAPQRIW